jgi:hypothetical protein
MRIRQRVALLEERLSNVEDFLQENTYEEEEVRQPSDLDLRYSCVERAADSLRNDVSRPTIEEIMYFADQMYKFIKASK